MEGHCITSCCVAPRLCATTGGIVCLGERRQTALLLTTRRAASPFKNARGPTVRPNTFHGCLWTNRVALIGHERTAKTCMRQKGKVPCRTDRGQWRAVWCMTSYVCICICGHFMYKYRIRLDNVFILIKKWYQPKEMNEFNLMLNILLFTCCCIVMLWNWLN